jgi:regulator of RNase E activity RraA
VFCRAVSPRGPHKGFGGTIDGTISCGGVAVSPGDLVIGDDNGVVVVPAAEAEAVLEVARAGVERERNTMQKIEEGQTTAELLGIPDPEIIG